MKFLVKRKTILASICGVIVTVSLMSRANREITSEDIEFHADLDRTHIPDRENFAAENDRVSEEEIQSALKEERSLALPESVLSDEAASKKYGEAFIYNEKEGLSFSNPNCRRFIKKDGSYGDFGRIIEEYLQDDLKENPIDALLTSNSIVGMIGKPDICPRWPELSEDEKIKFWVWTIASIAYSESSCSPSPSAVVGPTDATAGLLQLEAGTRKNKKGKKIGLALRKSRGPNCRAASTIDIKKPYSNLRCGLDMMKQQLTNLNHGSKYDSHASSNIRFDTPIYPGEGMSAKSYWLKLRVVGGSTIGHNIRKFTPCFQ